LSLFDGGELFFAAVLLFPLLVLMLMALAARLPGSRLEFVLSAPVRAARALVVRFRVRSALAAIAILGLYLGWEIHAWRTWRLRSSYLQRAAESARWENENRSLLQSKQKRLASLIDDDRSPATELAAPEQGFYRSKAAYAAERQASRDRLTREISHLWAKIDAYAERARKYERAATSPWKMPEPDQPLSEPEFEAEHWLARREYSRALAAYDELARIYPDLVEGHSHAAWLRATCPDARYRDGKLAIRSATRACVLSDWRDAGELSILAAAFAEAGDFAQAVHWQQKAAQQTTDPRFIRFLQDRLALYMAGKPYRQADRTRAN
jgi:hypothetical protein